MLSIINEKFFGPILPIILITSGIYILFRYAYMIILHPIKIIKSLFSKNSNGKSSFAAACLALSGTLGVGNIAGVASAIAIGGAGAVFWMWVSAFFAMIIKYSEVVIAMHFKINGKGGAGYYLEYGLHSKKLGIFFSFLVILSSFTVGNIVQSSAAAEAMNTSFGISKLLIGIIIAVVTLILICGGVSRVTKFSSVVIPVLTLGYILLSFAIIIKNSSVLPSVFSQFFSNAFTPCAILGGSGGTIISNAIRYGTSRGILSNEAGCGTATYAHSSADNTPVEQGFWGIFEVFVDTILLCTLTALVILITCPSGDKNNGMALSIEAFSTVGYFGGAFIAVSSAIYAVASIVCWSYYGTEALSYISDNKRIRRLYLLLYSAAGIIGAVFAPKIVWELSDMSVTLMASINTLCICLLSKYSKRVTKDYFTKCKLRKKRECRVQRQLKQSHHL